MSKFKVGDRVVASSMPGCVWRLKEYEPRGMSDNWLATDESDGFDGVFHETIITGYFCDAASPHYTPDASGKDYLARCEETYSRDEMIGAYRFTIGKYVDRMGKKQGEPVEKELDKIIDYATRAKEWLGRQ